VTIGVFMFHFQSSISDSLSVSAIRLSTVGRRQGSHFLENHVMSGNSVLTGMSGNFAVCRGIMLLLMKR